MRKIGILVDGKEEEISLRHIVGKILIHDTQIITPVYAPMQPKASALQIVKAVEGRLNLLVKKTDLILVLIDFEDQDDCAVTKTIELKRAFQKHGYAKIEL